MVANIQLKGARLESSSRSTSKAGSEFITLGLTKDDKRYKVFIFDTLLLQTLRPEFYRSGNIVDVTIKPYHSDYTLVSGSIQELAPVGISRESRESNYTKYLSIIKELFGEESTVYKFIVENEEKMKVAPAATSHHHNFVGGLLVHQLEAHQWAKLIIRAVKQIVPVRELDEVNILRACIVHDLGKYYEYDINADSGEITFNKEWREKYSSHSVWGFGFFFQDYPEVARYIGSHHIVKDWDSIITPDSSEQWVVICADNLSARTGLTSVELIQKLAAYNKKSLEDIIK